MSQYTIDFPEEGAPGNWPPYAAMMTVMEHVAVNEDACGGNGEKHHIKILTSMDPEVVAIRLAAPERYHPNMRTQHIVAKWVNGPFVQYMIWDSSKQAIVDMVEA